MRIHFAPIIILKLFCKKLINIINLIIIFTYWFVHLYMIYLLFQNNNFRDLNGTELIVLKLDIS
jgi:hypothetical protein